MGKKNKPKRNCENSIQRLVRGKTYFSKFENLEDWYVNEDEEIVTKEIEYFSHIKNYILNHYKIQDIYISSSALDDIIFHCLQHSETSTFLSDVFDLIEHNDLTSKSIVIFPVHNFGLQFLGLGNRFNQAYRSLKYDNFQINTQTNSFDLTLSKIKKYLKDTKFSKIKTYDESLVQHFYKSRDLRWLDKNPTVFFNFNFTQYERFDNVSFILEKMSFITNKLYFLSVLRSEKDHLGVLFSSKNTNNWETLDLKHFLTITGNGREGNVNCIPIHYKYSLLYDEMHLNIDLLVQKKSVSKWEAEAVNCIDIFYEGNKNFLVTKDRKYLIYHRVANSLKYFRRSVKSINNDDKIINLNIALESILLDNEGEKKDKILTRTRKSLKHSKNITQSIENIENVILERNTIIHNGFSTNRNINFEEIYRTYCKIILFLSKNINDINPNLPNCMSEFYSGIK